MIFGIWKNPSAISVSCNPAISNLTERCQTLTSRVEWLLATTGIFQLILIVVLVLQPNWTPVKSIGESTQILTALWLVWLLLLSYNFRLVICGHQEFRYLHAPRLINRPNLPVRLTANFLTNWAVIVTTMIYAWSTDDVEFSRFIGWFLQVAIFAAWISFNLLHRRMNRVRNVVGSTIMLIVLIASCWILLLQD